MRAVWCIRNLHIFVCNSGRLDYGELANILRRNLKGEHVPKKQKNARLMKENVEDFDHHGWLKVEDLVDEETTWICWFYPLRHKKTLHCANRKAKLFGNWIMHHLKL